MGNFLETIRPLVLKRVEGIKPLGKSERAIAEVNFLDAFKKPKPVIITEIKLASPSRGKIHNAGLDPVAIAGSYLAHGASAISVLTEPHYFKGNIEFIRDIRRAYPDCNILLKDFILDERQISQGKEYGANAVLLNPAFIEPDQLKHLYDFALNLGMTPLTEVHNVEELNSILHLESKLIGIHNQDLQSLKIDLSISRDLINKIPESSYAICESGIESGRTIKEMMMLGFDGFLIGSSLMETSDPGAALGKMLNEMKNES